MKGFILTIALLNVLCVNASYDVKVRPARKLRGRSSYSSSYTSYSSYVPETYVAYVSPTNDGTYVRKRTNIGSTNGD